MYKGECIQENSGTKNGDPCITASHDPPTYKPSPEVVTYYYKGDKGHKNPLLVVLKQANWGSGDKYQPYYELQRPTSTGTGDVKKYEKQDKSIDLSNTKKLGEKLDKILYEISQRLQVILDQRPLPQLYSPTDSSKCKVDDYGLENIRKGYYDSLKNPYCSNNCNEEQKKIIDEEIKKLSEYFFYHVPLKTCYKAQLYPPNGSEVQTGSNTTHVVVEEVRKCKELALRGYRCYKHKLTEVVGIEEVGRR